MLFGIPKISISEDTVFMKNTFLYFFFFEVATTRFTDNIKENASSGSSTAKENHPSLRRGLPTQFSLYCSVPSVLSNDPASVLQDKLGLPSR